MQEQFQRFILDIKSNKINATINEEATKQAIVLRVLHILGWEIFNNDEVWPEYVIEGKRVDYALRYNGRDRVFIEVKRMNEDLENHQEQLLNYSFRQGIEIAVLTNGLSWWFYLPLISGSWEQRKFYTIDLESQEEEEIFRNYVKFLSKENIISGRSVEIAQTFHKSKLRDQTITSSLPKAWNKLIQETDENLIELLNDTNEKLCGYRASNERIAEFLYEHKESLILGLSSSVQQKNVIINQKQPSRTRRSVETGYTGKTPTAFTINNYRVPVKTWKDIIIHVCNFLYHNHSIEFEERVSALRARFLSSNPDELRYPIQIKNSQLFIETNLSANDIVKRCENLLAMFGYESDLKIETV